LSSPAAVPNRFLNFKPTKSKLSLFDGLLIKNLRILSLYKIFKEFNEKEWDNSGGSNLKSLRKKLK
tara:strand:+ start:20 stop:217 length:198 start_codon:yes stop_codon:yes gene_type:complete